MKELGDLVQDMRYAVRVFRSHPSFTIAALLSLALGIGANTAIFTLVDAAMLKPLPVKDPDRLVELLTNSGQGRPSNAFTYQALLYLREHAATVDVIASHSLRLFAAAGSSPPEFSPGQFVTGDFFSVLGVSASRGRTIQAADDRPDAPAVAVLSHAYWQRRFAGDPSAVGGVLTLNDRPFTVVGIAPASFRGTVVGSQIDFWIPLSTEQLLRTPSWTSSAGYNWLQVVSRVRPGRTLDEARAELTTLYRAAQVEPKLASTTDAAAREYISRWRPAVASARSGLSQVRQQYAEPLFVLLAISGFVLLIACVNVANLLLARANTRRQEVAVRLSLGATRARVMRQLLTESMLLAVAGAAAGVALSFAGCEYLLGFFETTRTPMVLNVTPDLRVLTFTAVVAVATGLLFGIAPAWRVAAPSHAASLQAGGRVRGERDRRALGRVLIAAQVSLSVVMLFGAGLFVRSLHNIRSVETGFDSTGVLIVSADTSRTRLDADAHRTIFREALASLGSMPGAQSASLSQVTPIQGGGIDGTVVLPGDGRMAPREVRGVYINLVSPGYFGTLGISIYAGRDFSWQDTAARPKVAIINRAMARQYFGGENAIGARIEGREGTYEIVGIVADAKYIALREAMHPTVFLHWFQQSDAAVQRNAGQPLITIRTNTPARSMSEAVRARLLAAAPSIAIRTMRTLEDQIDESIVRERLLSTLSGFFAALGLLLAAIGLYGVMAYTVARRTNEIGIRVALGAQRSQITGMVLKEALVLIASGSTIGIVAAQWLSRPLAALLFELQPDDPSIAAAAAALMVLVGAAAAYFPGRRAARIDPVAALRME